MQGNCRKWSLGKGVGCVDTTRLQTRWPPNKFQAIKDDCFNTIYLYNDEEGFHIFLWVYKIKVTMVSSTHTREETVKQT